MENEYITKITNSENMMIPIIVIVIVIVTWIWIDKELRSRHSKRVNNYESMRKRIRIGRRMKQRKR